jgi:phage terminase small subunit
MSWGPDGVVLKESSELSADHAAIVAEVSETRTVGGGSIKAKLWSKSDALEKLARHLGLYSDKAEVDVNLTEIRRTIIDPTAGDG